MDNKEKTHYRKVFKSDHLGVADLEDLVEMKSSLIFNIKHVRQEMDVRVAGKKGNFNIAYFDEPIKPLVLNAGNSKIMKGLCGGSSFVEDWANTKVQLYIDPNARFGGEITGGVRINPNAPARKQELHPANDKLWNNAKMAYKRDGNFLKVLERVDISESNMKKLMDECKDD